MKGPPFMQPWLGKEKQKTARRKNIPTKIIQKFTSLFPSTKDENWTYHRETYFVTFYHHNRFCRVELTKKGELAHVFHKTSRNAIPKDLAKKMLSNRLGYHLLHVMAEIQRNQTNYYLLLHKNNQPVILAFDSNGKLIREAEPAC